MDELDIVACIGVILTILTTAAFCILALIEFDWEGEITDKCKQWIKFAKYSAVVFAIFTAFSAIIPDSNTITKMVIAQNVTYERVEVATDTVQEVYEDIMELLKEEPK